MKSWDEENNDDSGNSNYKKDEPNIGEKEIEKVKMLCAQLKPIADKEGCSVSELAEKYGESDEEEAAEGDDGDEGSDDGGKMALIIARMKSKNSGDEG